MTLRATPESLRPVSWPNFWFPGSRNSHFSFLLWLLRVLRRKVLLDCMRFVLLCEDRILHGGNSLGPDSCSPNLCDDHHTPTSPKPDTAVVGL
jgi:hypothetical protein